MPAPEFDSLTFDATDLTFSSDVSPSTIGLAIGATELVLDMKGVQGVYYDIKGLETALISAAAPSGYDFSSLAALSDPDMFGPAFLDILRQQIIDGGDVKLTFAATSSDTVVQMNDPFLPLTSIATASGASSGELSIDADSIDLVSTGEVSNFQLAGQIAGRVDVGAADMEIRVPIAAAPEPQKATVKYALREIVIDDQLWALMDPSGALDHTITGVNIDVDMDLTLYAGLLTDPCCVWRPVSRLLSRAPSTFATSPLIFSASKASRPAQLKWFRCPPARSTCV